MNAQTSVVPPPLPKVPDPMKTCVTCQWWEAEVPYRGYCHHGPPPFPLARAADWCGQHRTKKAKA